jgi:riboflavin-specific deaminase-like protein
MKDRPGESRPFVLLNMAMSADGKIATANRLVTSFGSPRDHAHLLELRSTADAVMCGAGTADSPDVTLGEGGPRHRRRRLRRGLAEFNLRVVVSGRATLQPDAGVFHEPGGPVVVLVCEDAPAARRRRLQAAGAEVAVFGKARVDLPRALAWLKQTRNVSRLVCEGGGDLNDAMFRSGLIDEIHLTLCPLVFGGRKAPTIAEGLGFARLPDAPRFEWVRLRRVGTELFATLRAVPPGSPPSLPRPTPSQAR